MLRDELTAMGASDVHLDDNCYLYARIPSNSDSKVPTIGFIAHLDTSPDVSGKDVKPQIVKDAMGRDIVTSDGTTLLGADDKAGIAAIMTAAGHLLSNPSIKHGDVAIAFTPDEEIGRGADNFDIDRFNAEWAYTVDGGDLGEIEFENFNAAKAIITIHGRNVHPGYAKGTMKNSMLIANKLIDVLGGEALPENTDGYKGFYHLSSITGDVETTMIRYIIRDFDKEEFENKKRFMRFLQNSMNEQFGDGTMDLEITDQYANMAEVLNKHPHIVETAMEAMRRIDVTPCVTPIRGGTDGARLSFMGLPCPNLFAGGINFHSRNEYIPVASLGKATETVLSIIECTLSRC